VEHEKETYNHEENAEEREYHHSPTPHGGRTIPPHFISPP
jgi:hypothetical protein